jgi:tRNA modification GTPase
MTEPTWIACLTPAGKGAVATLAVRGPLAWPVTRALLRPRRGELPAEPSAGAVWLGQIGEDVRDEVVLAVQRAGPDARLEVHCHGGPAVVRLIEELYARHGVQPCTWQDLERRTGGPPWQVVAQEWLVQAPTERTALILLDQYDGAFHRAVGAVRAALAAGHVAEARQRLDQLASRVALGRHLVRPWSVVVAGAPNVGKSSLVNAVAGYTRSVVAPTAGTTRDVVRTVLAIDGWPVELCDTAGLRTATGAIEGEGIERARAAVAEADLCLWVLDGAAEPVFPDDGTAWQPVINKTDLPPGWDWSRIPEALRVSALTRDGVAELCDAVSRRLVPEPPQPGEAVPFSPEWCDRVEEANRLLRDGRVREADERLG